MFWTEYSIYAYGKDSLTPNIFNKSSKSLDIKITYQATDGRMSIKMTEYALWKPDKHWITSESMMIHEIKLKMTEKLYNSILVYIIKS